jgi:hypothetical protein
VKLKAGLPIGVVIEGDQTTSRETVDDALRDADSREHPS